MTTPTTPPGGVYPPMYPVAPASNQPGLDLQTALRMDRNLNTIRLLLWWLGLWLPLIVGTITLALVLTARAANPYLGY